MRPQWFLAAVCAVALVLAANARGDGPSATAFAIFALYSFARSVKEGTE